MPHLQTNHKKKETNLLIRYTQSEILINRRFIQYCTSARSNASQLITGPELITHTKEVALLSIILLSHLIIFLWSERHFLKTINQYGYKGSSQPRFPKKTPSQ